MTKLSVDRALLKAKSYAKKGDVEEAQKLYQAVLQAFPNNKRAQQGLAALNKAKPSTVTQGPPQEAINHLMNLYNQGQLVAVVEQTQALTEQYPEGFVIWNILGAANKGLGRVQAASEAFKKVTELNPTYADGFNNLGLTLQDQGKLDEAITSLEKALYLKPDYADAYNNMGIVLKNQGKLEEAIEGFNKALSLKPDYAEAYNNMGIAFKNQGKLEEALEAYNKALSLKPDYAEAYNNMGIALYDQGKIGEAIESYNNALSVKPDYAEAFWNLSGTAENINDAKSWIEACLRANQDHLDARLALSALQFYEGDKSGFNALAHTHLKDHPAMRSFAWVFDLPELPELYFNRWAFFDRMVDLSEQDRPFYEFGVWRGVSFQRLIKTFKKGYGFDTFEGIPEDWHNEKAGTYSSDGNIPEIEGGKFIVGKFENSLPEFFSKTRQMASLINFDADLYSSTICALNHSQSVIDHHTILIFDEFIMNTNWEHDEYKALNEFCLNNNYTYEVLAISFFTKQTAVRLIRC